MNVINIPGRTSCAVYCKIKLKFVAYVSFSGKKKKRETPQRLDLSIYVYQREFLTDKLPPS